MASRGWPRPRAAHATYETLAVYLERVCAGGFLYRFVSAVLFRPHYGVSRENVGVRVPLTPTYTPLPCRGVCIKTYPSPSVTHFDAFRRLTRHNRDTPPRFPMH